MKKCGGVIEMSDWNEQAAPNNNLNPDTLRKNKNVVKSTAVNETQASMEMPTIQKNSEELDAYLKSRQPGM
jgi:hypothetical protein